jgi:hypothetical protein
LNAFSVDDSQQLDKEEPSKEALNKKEFNKEAYLDLSKPCDFFEYSRGLVVLLGRLWIALLVRLAEV